MHRRIARVCKCGALVKVERQQAALGMMLRAASDKVDALMGTSMYVGGSEGDQG